MSDIVEKLRQRTDYSTMLLCDPPRPAPDRLCHDAADEIEFLRKDAAKLRETLHLAMKAIKAQSSLESEIAHLRSALQTLTEMNKIELGFLTIKEAINYTQFMARAALATGVKDE